MDVSPAIDSRLLSQSPASPLPRSEAERPDGLDLERVLRRIGGWGKRIAFVGQVPVSPSPRLPVPPPPPTPSPPALLPPSTPAPVLVFIRHLPLRCSGGPLCACFVVALISTHVPTSLCAFTLALVTAVWDPTQVNQMLGKLSPPKVQYSLHCIDWHHGGHCPNTPVQHGAPTSLLASCHAPLPSPPPGFALPNSIVYPFLPSL